MRRSQMLLESADGQTTTAIATQLRCNDQTVRNAIHTFNARGVAALQPKSSRPHTRSAVFDDHRRNQLRALLHQQPAHVRQADLRLDARPGRRGRLRRGDHRRGRSAARRSARPCSRLGVGWKRAKHWITSPDPAYLRKKGRATG